MQYIILLRGINVGGRKILMAELKSCFEKAGYKNVTTILQTGNVILKSEEKNKAQFQKQVETLLSETFDYPARVLVLQPAELEATVLGNPFSAPRPEFHRYIVFTEAGFENELIKQAGELDTTVEAVSAGAAVVYWRVLKGHTLDSAFGKYMSKAATRHFMTNRNVNTLKKILAVVKQ